MCDPFLLEIRVFSRRYYKRCYRQTSAVLLSNRWSKRTLGLKFVL